VVIRLVRFVHVPRRFRRQVTNTFLFARDRYRCQYCGRHRTDLRDRHYLTRDHVVPISRGGDNSWRNVVTACSPCNNRKASHLPEECGMAPIHVPREPNYVELVWAVRRITPPQAKYIRMFYGEDTLPTPEFIKEAAKRRRNQVLRKMAELGMVTEEKAQKAMSRNLGIKRSEFFTRRREEYFFDYVKDQLFREYGAATVRQGGMKVYTTIDLEKQEQARDTIADHIGGIGPSSAIVTLNWPVASALSILVLFIFAYATIALVRFRRTLD
jgi:hypothetical protein